MAESRSSQRRLSAPVSDSGAASADLDETLRTGSGAPGHSLEQALGSQIRLLRKRVELTVAELAGSAGISPGMLSKIENGQISPSLSTLHAVAGALGVPMTRLFASFEEQRDCSYVRAGDGVAIERRGSKAGHRYQLLGHGLDGPVVVEPYLITLQEEAVPYPGFHHAGVEFIYMLSGEVVYRHGEQNYHLRPGDALLFDSAATHGPERLITRPLTFLSIIIYPRGGE